MRENDKIKAVLSAYLINEFDEINKFQKEGYYQHSRDEIEKEIGDYIASQYESGQKSTYSFLGVAFSAAILSQKRILQVVNYTINGATFAKRLSEIKEIYNKETQVVSPELIRLLTTEGHRAFVMGQMDAAKAIEKKENLTIFKRWDATLDNVTRKSHVILNGDIQPLDGTFISISGASAMAPGLFNVAQEDVNCRCVLTFLSY